jgi:hypothetical protein
MRSILFLFCFLSCGAFALLYGPGTARADIRECGTPKSSSMETDPGFVYCDIHQRRFAYKESRDEFNRQLDERRANYLAPGLQARKDYEKDLQALYSETNSENH